jgi:alpha-amylase
VPLSVQQHDNNSVFTHYQTLISLRKSEPALSQLFAPNLHRVCLHDDQLLAYFRPHVDKSLIIIHNLSSVTKEIPLPDDKSDFDKILFSSDPSHSEILSRMELAPYSSLILSSV